MSLFRGMCRLPSLIFAGGHIFLTILSVWAAEQKHLLRDVRSWLPIVLSYAVNMTDALIEALQSNKPIKVAADDDNP